MRGIGWDLMRKLRGKPWVVFYESFTGDGSTKTFTLDGTILNATFLSSVWNVANVQLTKSVSVTKTNGKAIYDSANVFTRHRIASESISAAGVVTLDYAPRNDAEFYIYYWYELPNNARLSDYYRDDIVSKFEADEPSIASSISVDVTSFAGKLSATDDTAQKALDTLDDHIHPASEVEVKEFGTATYDDIQDYLNNTMSSGYVLGGLITAADPADGTVDVSAVKGYIRATDTEIAEIKAYDLAGSNIALTDKSTNYIYVDYYQAGAPYVRLQVTTDRSSIGLNDEHTLGRVYRNGNSTHIIQSGIQLPNFLREEHERVFALRWFERASGGNISIAGAAGSREIQSDSGVFYLGRNKIETAAKTSASDKFTTWYYDGDLGPAAWVETADQTQIDKLQYNAVATGLANIDVARYGVHWVYIAYDGSLHVLYGQDSYKAVEAEGAQVPSSLPDFLANFAILACKITVAQNVDIFYDISSAYSTAFPVSSPEVHNDLTGLNDGDDYEHITQTQKDALHAAGSDTALGAQSENLDMNTHKIVGVVDPTSDQEAATKKYVDDNAAGVVLAEVLTWSTL